MSDAHSIASALGFRWHGSYGVGRCPAHNDTNPSCSVRNGDRSPVFTCFSGCSSAEIVAALPTEVQCLLGGVRAAADDAERERLDHEREVERARDRAARINQARDVWRRAAGTDGSPVVTYLRRRAITGPVPRSLRFHAECFCRDVAGPLPAMVAAVQVGEQFVGVHRTYLTPDGVKADIPTAKSTLGPIRGGAVRLTDRAPTLVVAEGIETALSVRDALAGREVAVWAAMSAPNMAVLDVPDWAEEVVVAADVDPAGLNAANHLAQRCTDRSVPCRLMLPAEPHKDFNDAARSEVLA